MEKHNGSKEIAEYMHQELVRLHGPQYGLLGEDERNRLFQIGLEFNKRFGVKLLAHGVDSTSLQNVAQIFLDGKLRHYLYQENYGELGVPYRGVVGHWDFGKGLFVARRDKILANRERATGADYSVPLEDIEAVVFPTEVANMVKQTFPSKERIVKGYAEYARQLETQNMIFDIDQRRKR